MMVTMKCIELISFNFPLSAQRKYKHIQVIFCNYENKSLKIITETFYLHLSFITIQNNISEI